MDRYIDMASIRGRDICHGKFTVQHTCVIGIGVLIHIYLFWYRKWKPTLHLKIQGKRFVNKGGKATLEGTLQFHQNIKYIKWQKYYNGEYVDINIHSSKYNGTTNSLHGPTLFINDFDANDEVLYRLKAEMTNTTKYSNPRGIRLLKPETSTINLSSDQMNNKYYVGEIAIITASIHNPSAVLSMTWQRETENGRYTIDTSLPEYSGSKLTMNEQRLVIQDCKESDRGMYFLLAACIENRELNSNRIFLDIVQDCPMVTLDQVFEALYGTCVEFKARIRSFPKHRAVIWKKWEKGKDERIDITQQKYVGSSVVGDCPVLCINNASKDDEDFYSVEVNNALGTRICKSEKLKVTGEKPIVTLKIPKQSQSVTYGNTITIEATVDSSPKALNIEWKKNDNTIQSDGRKFIINESNKSKPKLTILCLDFDDSGNYAISVTNALGSTEEEICINVKGDKIIFISGPLVVLPAGKILFRAVKPQNINITREEWYNTNNNITRKIKSEEGISLKPDVSTLEIDNATAENSGTYQLSVESSIGTLKSNTITVFVDGSERFATEKEGNCLRFYTLQSECRETMRRAMDGTIRSFSTTWALYLQRHAAKKIRISLPSSTPSSTSDLDVSLMYSIFRNAIKMPNPSKGWGMFPDANDINISDDIERIRHYRNKVSHENSAEMTTEDFNTSVLDLIMAIRRITADDEQMLKQLSDKLKKVFYQGPALKNMMETLDNFRRMAAKEEQQLKENDESEIIYTRNDEQSIKFTGCNELYIGEKAKFMAFIDPKISKLCNIFWKRTDERGNCYTIDIKDGKYEGSTLTFPSPELHIHFVRKQDSGTYRLFVDTFNKVVHNCVKLVVKEGECDEEKEEAASESKIKIGFHNAHDANVALLHDNTIARKTNGEDKNGLCFTNRSLQIGEKIYIRIAETNAKWSSSMDFGLTNKNPSNIVFRQDQSIREVRKTETDEPFHYLPDFNDVLCFKLNSNATLSFSVNGIIKRTLSLKYVSINNPVWLCFDLYGKTRAIEISNKKPKKKPFDSFAREYSF